MGLIRKVIVGRWFTRWLLRGGPWGVAAKLAGVALWGVWKWRRERREAERAQQAREIPAEYEVLDSNRSEIGGDGT
ncbi:MAG TPA: hypothetical protein VM737_00370 [Gemmatimonadota bacterium]|nr:hypothetical protein [Gemmatimonadota bacterium]